MGMVCLAKGMTASLLAACLLSAGLVPAVWLPTHAAGPPRPAADSLQPAARPATERAHAAGPQDKKHAGPSSGVRYGLVIAGLGGEQKYVDQHLTWARGFFEVLKVEHGFPEDRLYLLVEDPDAAGGPPAVKSTLEEIRAVLAELARLVRPGDDLFVLLIGHGSATGTGPRLNIPGPDLTADTLRDALGEIEARYTVVVNGASSSAPFIDALTGPGRVIVTATKSGAERLSTVFPEHLLDALKAQAGDLDKDGRVSVLESFVYARNKTAEWYDGQGLLATEHALLDDNGDGRGTREPGPGGTDGTLAGRIYFGRGPGGPEAAAGTVTPGGQALQARMEDLRWSIDELRARKEQEDPGEYAARMEEMLIELARVTRQLRELQTPEEQSP
ncbi:MAG: hypothetical protein F4Z81_05375 [Gemmatimonadetes bacterium]|nr:hypothetical protein [Gemmatimonadota bacterium]MYB59856.1 hypothetical protein [Gemmatimonadota bacterium]